VVSKEERGKIENFYQKNPPLMSENINGGRKHLLPEKKLPIAENAISS